MDISIIIPIYNAEKYLERCLKSITENNDSSLEIILINDGSKDSSEKICKSFMKVDKRIKYISIKNNGCSNARNLGINLSIGKYIWFIDSDDFIEKNSISEILKEIKENPEIIVFGMKIIKNDKSKAFYPKIEKKEKFIYNQTIFFNQPWNKLYKSEIIKKNNIYFKKDCHMGEDMAFNFRYFYYIEKINFVKKTFYNYYLGEGVTSSPKKRIEIFNAFDDIFTFYWDKDFNNIKKILKKYYKLNAIKSTYSSILKSDLKKYEKKNELKKINFELKKRKHIFNSEFLILQFFYSIVYNFLIICNLKR